MVTGITVIVIGVMGVHRSGRQWGSCQWLAKAETEKDAAK